MALIKNSFRFLTSGIGFLIIGIVLLVMSVGDIIDNAKTPADYSTLQMEDFKAGMMVEGDLELNYGSYVEMTRENDSGSKTVVGYYYLIDAGDDGFMALYTPMKDLISKLDRQADRTLDILYGYSDTLPDTVHFKGKVTKMDSEDIGLFHDELESWGYSASEIEDIGLELYIKVTDTTSHPIILVFGIVITLLGLLFVFLFIRRKMMGR